jgi:hypothetical protein
MVGAFEVFSLLDEVIAIVCGNKLDAVYLQRFPMEVFTQLVD